MKESSSASTYGEMMNGPSSWPIVALTAWWWGSFVSKKA
jgi:hypothetical protein